MTSASLAIIKLGFSTVILGWNIDDVIGEEEEETDDNRQWLWGVQKWVATGNQTQGLS